MNYNNFSEIRKRLLAEDNNALLLDAHDTFPQQDEIRLAENEKQKQLQLLEKENELKRQQEIIQQQKDLELAETEKQKQAQIDKENELRHQQQILQQQKEIELADSEKQKKEHIEEENELRHQQKILQQQKELELADSEKQKKEHIEEENELKRQQKILQQEKRDEIQLAEIEKQKLAQIDEENELRRQQQILQQQKELELAESEKQKQAQIDEENELRRKQKILQQQKGDETQLSKIEKDKQSTLTNTEIELQNKSSNASLIKVSILSIITSILICVLAFFLYKKYYEADSIRDAKKAFAILTEQNHNYYAEKETIFKDFLKSFANSNTYNIEIKSKLQSDLINLEAKKAVNIDKMNKNIGKLRSHYLDRKGSLIDFDYAYNKMVNSFKNNDSINILPIENKVNKIITLFSQQNSSIKTSPEKIKNDIINKPIFGWGKIEKEDLKSIVYNTELSDNDKYIVSINLEKNGIKSIAELTITYNMEVFSDLKTNKITFPNVAPANSWFNFTPIPNCIIQVNTFNNPISFKSCESCSQIKINSNIQNPFNLDDISQTVSITSDTNADVIVNFMYIPK